MQTIQIILNTDSLEETLMISNKIGFGWTLYMVKKIVIFKSGSDFAAINFDVLNRYFGGIFWRKKQWKFF